LGIYVVGGAGGTQGSPIFFAYAGLTVNLVPETTDTVVLTTPGGPQTLAYATTSGGYAIYDYFSFAGGYVPGQNYQLTVTTSIGTATSSLLTAPGNITLDPSGNFASWTVEGNADSLTVANQTPVTTYNSTSAVGPDIDSFFNIPAGAYPTTGINYTINMNAAETNAVWTGAAAGSIFLLYESASVTVSK
jgi:hypothetical protein